MKNARSPGQPVHQLQKVVNNSPSMAANQGALESAKVSDWVSPAQHCAVANIGRANIKHCPQKKLDTTAHITETTFFFLLLLILGGTWGQNNMSIHFFDPKNLGLPPKKQVSIFICC